MTVEQQVRHFILENYLFTDDETALQNDQSFLEQGILDSTGIMELIYFLEEEYGVKVADHEMVPENLDSVGRVVAYVGKKKAAGEAG